MRRLLSCLLLGAALILSSANAIAQETSSKGEGAIGGALLGAEVVVFSEAVAGVEPLWAYVLGTGLAAAGGAYAGLRIAENSDPDVSNWMVGAGVVLLLPTVVWVGDAREKTTPPEPVTIARSQERFAQPPLGKTEFQARPGVYLPIVSGRF